MFALQDTAESVRCHDVSLLTLTSYVYVYVNTRQPAGSEDIDAKVQKELQGALLARLSYRFILIDNICSV